MAKNGNRNLPPKTEELRRRGIDISLPTNGGEIPEPDDGFMADTIVDPRNPVGILESGVSSPHSPMPPSTMQTNSPQSASSNTERFIPPLLRESLKILHREKLEDPNNISENKNLALALANMPYTAFTLGKLYPSIGYQEPEKVTQTTYPIASLPSVDPAEISSPNITPQVAAAPTSAPAAAKIEASAQPTAPKDYAAEFTNFTSKVTRKNGMAQGVSVLLLQQYLLDQGYGKNIVGFKVDGIYGMRTAEAITEFQKKNNLPATGGISVQDYAFMRQASFDPDKIKGKVSKRLLNYWSQVGTARNGITFTDVEEQTAPGATPATPANSQGTFKS